MQLTFQQVKEVIAEAGDTKRIVGIDLDLLDDMFSSFPHVIPSIREIFSQKQNFQVNGLEMFSSLLWTTPGEVDRTERIRSIVTLFDFHHNNQLTYQQIVMGIISVLTGVAKLVGSDKLPDELTVEASVDELYRQYGIDIRDPMTFDATADWICEKYNTSDPSWALLRAFHVVESQEKPSRATLQDSYLLNEVFPSIRDFKQPILLECDPQYVASDADTCSAQLHLTHVHGFRVSDRRNTVHWIQNGGILSISGKVAVLESENGRQVFYSGHQRDITCLCVFKTQFVATVDDRTIHIWTIPSIETQQVIQLGPDTRNTNYVAVSTDQRYLVCCCRRRYSNLVLLFQLDTQQCVGQVNFPRSDPITSLSLTEMTLMVSTMKEIHLLDTSMSLKPKQSAFQTTGALSTCDFGKWMLVGTINGVLLCYNELDYIGEIYFFKHEITCIWSNDDNTMLLAADTCGHITSFDYDLNPVKEYHVSEWFSGNPSVQSILGPGSNNSILIATRGASILDIENQIEVKSFHTIGASISLHPTQPLGLTVGLDKKLQLWNLETFQVVKETKTSSGCSVAAWHPTQNIIAAAMKTEGIEIIDTLDWQILNQFGDTAKCIFALEYSSNGSFLAAAVAQKSTIYLYEAENGYMLYTVVSATTMSPLTAISFSPDSKLLHVRGNESKHWDIHQKQFISTTSSNLWEQIATNRGDSWSTTTEQHFSIAKVRDTLVLGDHFGNIGLAQADAFQSGSENISTYVAHGMQEIQVVVSRDGTQLVSVGRNDGSIFYWTVDMVVFDPIEANVMKTRLKSLPNRIYSCNEMFRVPMLPPIDDAARFLPLVIDLKYVSRRIENGIPILQSQNRIVYAVDNLIFSYNTTNQSRQTFHGHDTPVTYIAIHPDKTTIASSQSRKILLWHLQDPTSSQKIRFDISHVYSMAFSSKTLVCYVRSPSVHSDVIFIYDIALKTVLATHAAGTLVSICATEFGFISIGTRLMYWYQNDAQKLVCLGSVTLKAPTAVLLLQKTSDNGAMVVVGDAEGNIGIYHDNKRLKKIQAHPIRVCEMRKGAKSFFSCGLDGKIKQWSSETFALVQIIFQDSPIRSFLINSDYIVVKDDSQNIYLHRGESKEAIYLQLGDHVVFDTHPTQSKLLLKSAQGPLSIWTAEADGTLRFLRAGDKKQLQGVVDARFIANGKFVIAILDDNSIVSVVTKNLSIQLTKPCQLPTDATFCDFAASPDGRSLAFLAQDLNAYVINAVSLETLGVCRAPPHICQVDTKLTKLAYSDSSFYLKCFADQERVVWDLLYYDVASDEQVEQCHTALDNLEVFYSAVDYSINSDRSYCAVICDGLLLVYRLKQENRVGIPASSNSGQVDSCFWIGSNMLLCSGSSQTDSVWSLFTVEDSLQLENCPKPISFNHMQRPNYYDAFDFYQSSQGPVERKIYTLMNQLESLRSHKQDVKFLQMTLDRVHGSDSRPIVTPCGNIIYTVGRVAVVVSDQKSIEDRYYLDHDASIQQLSAHPTLNLVTTADADRIRIWDPLTLMTLFSIANDPPALCSVNIGFSRDTGKVLVHVSIAAPGTYLISVYRWQDSTLPIRSSVCLPAILDVSVLDTMTCIVGKTYVYFHQILQGFIGKHSGEKLEYTCVCPSLNGGFLIGTTCGSICEWSVSGSFLRFIEYQNPVAVCSIVMRSDNRILIGDSSGFVRETNCTSNCSQVELSSEVAIRNIDSCADIIVATTDSGDNYRMSDVDFHSVLRFQQGHANSITAMDARDAQIITGDSSGVLKRWDIATNTSVQCVLDMCCIKDITYSPEGDEIAVACDSLSAEETGMVRVLYAESLVELSSFEYPFNATTIRFAPDGEIFVVASTNLVQIYIVLESHYVLEASLSEISSPIQTIDFSSCSRMIQIGHRSSISYWDTKYYKELRPTQCSGVEWHTISSPHSATMEGVWSSECTTSNKITLRVSIKRQFVFVADEFGFWYIYSYPARPFASALVRVEGYHSIGPQDKLDCRWIQNDTCLVISCSNSSSLSIFRLKETATDEINRFNGFKELPQPTPMLIDATTTFYGRQSSEILAYVMSTDESLVATCEGNGSLLYISDAYTHSTLVDLNGTLRNGTKDMCFSPENDMLAVISCDPDQTLVLYKWRTSPGIFVSVPLLDTRIERICFGESTEVLYGSGMDLLVRLQLCHSIRGIDQTRKSLTTKATSLCSSGSLVFVGHDDGTITQFNCHTLELMQTISLTPGSVNYISAIPIRMKVQLAIVIQSPMESTVWDVNIGTLDKEESLLEISKRYTTTEEIFCIQCIPNSQKYAVKGKDFTLIVDLSTGHHQVIHGRSG